MALIHTLGAGTDAGSSWLRGFMLATAVPATALLARRLMRTKKAGRISVTPTKI
jgi:sulfoxide reductase heme-binding subunit YedZ